MSQIIQVNMAEIKIAFAPDLLTCVGIGSCVALILYNLEAKIGGLAHIMLPNSQTSSPLKKGMFADTAIDGINEEIKHLIRIRKVYAKIFGGASMFTSQVKKTQVPVGERNVNAIIDELKKRKITITSSDLRGSSGRSILFCPHTGKVLLRILKPPTIKTL
jgi:chemotaxis protein CheD